MLPITEYTDPSDDSPLIPQILLHCRGEATRWGKPCHQTVRVPVCLFDDIQDLQDYLMDQDFCGMFWSDPVPPDSEIENDDGEIVMAGSDVSVPVIEVACIRHAEPILEAFASEEGVVFVGEEE